MTPREAEAAELRKAAEQIAIRSVTARRSGRPECARRADHERTQAVGLHDTARDADQPAPRRAVRLTKARSWAKPTWPAIIPMELWQAVQRTLTDPARRTNHIGGTVKWLGSGIYKCGVCGSNDVRVGVTEGRKRYRCRNRVKGDPATHVGRDAHLLDAFVEAAVVARLSKPAVLDALRPAPPEVDVPGLRNRTVRETDAT